MCCTAVGTAPCSLARWQLAPECSPAARLRVLTATCTRCECTRCEYACAVSVPGLQHLARAVHGAAIRISLALFPGRVLPTLFASPQIGYTVTLNCALAEIERRDGVYSASESFPSCLRLCCEAFDVGDACLGLETSEENVVGYSSGSGSVAGLFVRLFLCGMLGCLPWGFWLPFRATDGGTFCVR